eukprot:6456774-Amphidinium_carterae.1
MGNGFAAMEMRQLKRNQCAWATLLSKLPRWGAIWRTRQRSILAVKLLAAHCDGSRFQALADDKAFLADLEKNCGTKKAEWEKIEKLRSEERHADFAAHIASLFNVSRGPMTFFHMLALRGVAGSILWLQELVAISETIKILNDDDALELAAQCLRVGKCAA